MSLRARSGPGLLAGLALSLGLLPAGAGLPRLAQAGLASATEARPIEPRAPQQPTPPFPTLIPTEPLPTLPPSVPTPAPFTPTATRELPPTASPTPVPPSATPSLTPDRSPTPTSYLGLSDRIWLPLTILFHAFEPFDLPTPEPGSDGALARPR